MSRVLIVSPRLAGDVPVRRTIHQARLFNLIELFNANGWDTTTDVEVDGGVEQYVAIERNERVSDDLPVRIPSYGELVREDLDWTDIDRINPGDPESLGELAELAGPWPPSVWVKMANRKPSSSVPHKDVGRNPEGGQGGRGFHPPAIGDRVPTGLSRAELEGVVVSADGSLMARLQDDALLLFDANGIQTNRYAGWVGERGLGSDLQLLAVSREYGRVHRVVVSNAIGSYSVATADRVAWSAPAFLGVSSIAAVVVDGNVLLVEPGGTVAEVGAEIGSPREPITVVAISSCGLDAAVQDDWAWLVVWGKDPDGKPAAEVLRRLRGQRAWLKVERLPGAYGARVERTRGRGMTRAGSPSVLVEWLDEWGNRHEFGGS